jgi:pyruvate,water dikinase
MMKADGKILPSSSPCCLFDEPHEAVKRSVRRLMDLAHEHDTPVGIRGQAPSDHPEFAEFLIEAGTDSIARAEGRR